MATATGQVPDVRGKSLRDAVADLVKRRLRVAAEGSGYVVHQDPQAGTAVVDGQICSLQLAETGKAIE